MRRIFASLALAACGVPSPPPQGPIQNVAPAGDGVPDRADVLLWCTARRGEACQRVARALGVQPTATDDLPDELFAGAWRDLGDDCRDPELASLLAELEAALPLPPGDWLDHTGWPTREGLGEYYEAGGCTNNTRSGVPSVKVQLVELRAGVPPTMLVRQWELGDGER